MREASGGDAISRSEVYKRTIVHQDRIRGHEGGRVGEIAASVEGKWSIPVLMLSDLAARAC